MATSNEVREFLRSRGCPDDVVSGGLEGLVEEWERVVEQVQEGYPLGLDDYLNDLDGRQLADDAFSLATDGEQSKLGKRLRAADERMKKLVKPSAGCLWGDKVARAEGWSAAENWWYYSVPKSPGPLLGEDLAQS
jgi:hypothetical protein